MHLRPSPDENPKSGLSFFLAVAAALGRVFLMGCGCSMGGVVSDSAVGEERGRRAELFQLDGRARERLLRALAGTETISGLKIAAALRVAVGCGD